MHENNEEVDLPWWQKFLLLAAVSIITLLIFLVPNWLGFNSTDEKVEYTGCETRLDPTPCPEPDYEQSVEEAKKYPDADPYGDYIDRPSGY